LEKCASAYIYAILTTENTYQYKSLQFPAEMNIKRAISHISLISRHNVISFCTNVTSGVFSVEISKDFLHSYVVLSVVGGCQDVDVWCKCVFHGETNLFLQGGDFVDKNVERL